MITNIYKLFIFNICMSNNKGLFRELFSFLLHKKTWWLVPTVIMLALVGVLIIFSQSSSVSPFIYALF